MRIAAKVAKGILFKKGAKSRIATAKLSFENTKTLYNRNKALYDKGVISKQDFENSLLLDGAL